MMVELTPILFGVIVCFSIASLLYGFLRIFIRRAQEYKELHKEDQWNDAMNTIIAGEAKGSLETEKEILRSKKKWQ